MTLLQNVILEPDLVANRPVAGTAGRLFFATDLLVLYRDNGSSWDSIEGASGGGVSDGDKGDITVSVGGTVWTLNDVYELAGIAAGLIATHTADSTNIHGIVDTANIIIEGDTRLANSRAPNGNAGGVLGGTYPNPSFAADMATQAELDAALASYQPLDSDLTAIAALITTSYGRSLLEAANAAAARATLGVSSGFTPVVTDFTASGSYVLPVGATTIRMIGVGAGGGGGSGRRGAAGSARFGGGGGGSAGYSEAIYQVSEVGGVGASLTITVGLGGTGAPAITVDNGDGTGGIAGGVTSIANGGTTVLWAQNGTAASGGTAAAGASGSSGVGVFNGASGGSSSTSATAGNGAQNPLAPSGAGAGGGIDTSNVARAGGAAGGAARGLTAAGITGASGGAATGVNGTSATTVAGVAGGGGGGGGGANAAGVGGTGGNGVRGGGGGGGGASVNGSNSGGGGIGGDGWVRIIVW